MKIFVRPILAFAIMMALAASSLAQTAAPVDLRILAINDFHGYLRPPPGGIRIADPDDKTKKITVAAGGAEHMATLVKQLRDGHKNTIFVAAGDLIGASPFLSAMFHDEPTIEVAVDDGAGYRLGRQSRIRRGQGRIAADAERRLPSRSTNARGRIRSSGAKFRYLAASTIEKSTGKTVLPAYEIRTVRRHSGRLHRPDAEGHAATRLAARASPASNSATRPRR